MTDSEHGQATRLAGIFLLGFFLPQSTGNEFFLLENLSSKRLKKTDVPGNSSVKTTSLSGLQVVDYVEEKEDMGEYIIQMSLEERLEACPHRYYPHEFGEFNSLVFDPLEDAFQSFLHQGLAPFLSGRPAHTTEVDLLHILAMAIHPQPSEKAIPQTVSRFDEVKSESWDKAKRLMSNQTAPSFHVNYRHRVDLVRLVTDCLVVPSHNKLRSSMDAPLFDGALPHLRAALYAFGMASIHPLDEYIADCGMVSLAVQSGINYVIREEWTRLSHKVVDDQTNYPTCPHCRCGTIKAPQISYVTPSYDAAFSLVGEFQNDNFCPHRARGLLLQGFLTRCNESRFFAEKGFLHYALRSLTDAIEMEVDLWTREVERDGGNKDKVDDPATSALEKTSHPTCVLASLLMSAKCLFIFMLPLKEEMKEDEKADREEQNESEERHRRDTLISCGIQLIHHWDHTIVRESCNMLLLAFSYAEESWENYQSAVFQSIKMMVERSLTIKGESDDSTPVPVEALVSAFSQRSLVFATSFMRLIHEIKNKKKACAVTLNRLVAAVAIARPNVAEQYRGVLEKGLANAESGAVAKHIVASLLACRRARFFSNEEDSGLKLKSFVSNKYLGNWSRYQIARQCLVTGHFSVAKTLFDDLASTVDSEKNFVWISALLQVSEGEAALALEGARALRDSSAILTMAMCTLRSVAPLVRLEGEIQCSFGFHVGFLELRVSFLDLLVAVRQLTREMRLVGNGPKKYTRPHYHLKNLVRGFFGLGHRYLILYKQHGLFLCQQSRSVLRTIRNLCDFVGRALQRVFQGSLPETTTPKAAENDDCSIAGDSSQPMTMLITQLESFALKDMDPSVEPKIRAAAMLEIMDGILKVPFPFPKSFLATKLIPPSDLHVLWDPNTHDQPECLQIQTDGLFSVIASGQIHTSLLCRAGVAFNIALLWYTLTPKGKAMKTESNRIADVSSRGAMSLKDPLRPPPIAASLSSSGSFFMKISNRTLPTEGVFHIVFRLGCRDIRGGEWELPISVAPATLSVELRKSS
jgi:hypothetical protein